MSADHHIEHSLPKGGETVSAKLVFLRGPYIFRVVDCSTLNVTLDFSSQLWRHSFIGLDHDSNKIYKETTHNARRKMIYSL